MRVLSARKDFTLETLRDAAYDSYLPAFADLIPTLVKAYDNIAMTDPLRAKLGEQVSQLRTWDYRWAENSVATTLAVFWGEEMWRLSRADAESEDMSVYDYMAKKTTPAAKLQALAAASDTLVANFGSWKTFWGDINRFQRRTGDIVQPFSDVAPSIAVPFTSSRWGSLASFGARPYHGHQEVVRYERQQLRGGGGVWRQRACQGGHRRWREWQSWFEALQRSGRALRRG